jgi:hypothetical protein
MRCNGCHGDAGGLGTRTYAELMSGGNLGKVVIPGEAERSLLVHFIEGRRGERQRMPLGGRPLMPEEIARIRRWIDEGAREDRAALPRHVRSLDSVSLPRGRTLRITCRVNTSGYLTLTLRDRRNRRPLLSRTASIKSPKEEADAGEPGETIWWDVRSENGWPKLVAVELAIDYAMGDPAPVELEARLLTHE